MLFFKNSIFTTVVLRITLATFVFLALLTGIVYLELLTTMMALRNHSVVRQAHEIASYLEKNDAGVLTLALPVAARAFYANAGRLHQYAVSSETGDVLFTSPVFLRDRYPHHLPEDTDDEKFFNFTDAYDTHFVGVSIRHDLGNEHYLVQVAQSEESASALPNLLSATFIQRAALAGLPFFVVLFAVIYWGLRWSMMPLNKASLEASRISFSSPDLRIDESGIPEEIRPLVSAFNKALDRLEAGIRSEREFIADAAHELRTPLTILRSHAEQIRNEEVAGRLREDVDAMSHLVTQLLDKARLNAMKGTSFEEIDLSAVVRKVCADMWPLLVREGREFAVAGIDQPIVIRGDEWAVYGALRNLIDNALGHTPPRTKIEILVGDRSVSVRDHGPGIAPEDRADVFKRFWRKNKSNTQGSGLGLAIVERIMELHGGTAQVEDAPGGGALFTLKFP